LRQSAGCFVAESDQIFGLAPFGRFLRAARRGHLADNGRQHGRSVLPPDQVEAFERLVDEVERVPAVGEGPFRLGREQGASEHGRRKAGVDRGEKGALGRLAMANLYPAWQPAFQNRRFRPAPERGAFPSGRLAVTIGRDAARSVEEHEISVILGQRGQEIAKGREDREADAPAVTVLRPVQRCLTQDVGFRNSSGKPTLHRLGDDEADVMGKSVVKPTTPVRVGIGVAERRPHPDLVVAHLDCGCGRVVRPQVEGAAAFEIEAGMVPVTGQNAAPLNTMLLALSCHEC